MSVIFQLFHSGQWHDAAQLTFTGDEMSAKARLTYFTDYLFSVADNNCIDNRACSVNAPLKADPEMVTRLFKWGDGFESGGKVNFLQVADQLSSMCDPNELITYLQKIAKRLKNLPTLLLDAGCPERIVYFPAIGFEFLESKFVQMGVMDE